MSSMIKLFIIYLLIRINMCAPETDYLSIDIVGITLNSTCADAIFERCRQEINDVNRVKDRCCIGSKRIECLRKDIDSCHDLNETINQSLMPFVKMMCKRQGKTFETACDINRDTIIMFVIGVLITIALISVIVFYAFKTYIF